jgi:hypothetical protein
MKDDASQLRATPPVWRQPDGAAVSCVEKIKVLNENYAELRQLAQDAFEDALLMGCSETQIRGVFQDLVQALVNPYPQPHPGAAAGEPVPVATPVNRYDDGPA